VEAVADFQDAIREIFPGFATEKQLQLALGAGEQGSPIVSSTTAYRFTNEGETWSILLTPDALTLEAAAGGRYSSYDEFSGLFETVWTAAAGILRPGKIRRQGLRYVDHLEGERSPKEWVAWINPELLGATAKDVLGDGLGQAVTQLIYTLDGGQIIVRHGTAAAGPRNLNGYLLDLDSIHTNPLEASDVVTVMKRFDESHDVLYRIFRWCVTDSALEEFRRAPG
jgi:uncharacterized protein (TIGR04255 family)